MSEKRFKSVIEMLVVSHNDEVAALEADLAEARTVHSAWTTAFGTTQLTHARAQVDALRAEVERKDAALRRYRQHENHCAAWYGRPTGEPTVREDCTCGLEAALSSGEGEGNGDSRHCGDQHCDACNDGVYCDEKRPEGEGFSISTEPTPEMRVSCAGSPTLSREAAERIADRLYEVGQWAWSEREAVVLDILDAAQEEK